jgi:hypothetical protein
MKTLAAAVILLASAPAWAFSIMVGNTSKPLRYTHPDLTYHLGTSAPSNLGQAALDAVEAGFQTWEAVSCSALGFTYLGTTSAAKVLPTGAEFNGKNEVIFSTQANWDHPYGVLGVTVPGALVDGRIIESDIAFSPDVNWTTSTNPGWGSMNIQGVATHEIGHFFGLQHVLADYGAVMVPATSDGVNELYLSQDDVNGVCYLYPTGAFACSSNSQCPYILDVNQSTGQEYYSGTSSCSGGKCVSAKLVEGTKVYGEPCPADSDCKYPYFCQQTAGGMLCSQECNPDAPDCPGGDACAGYADMPGFGVCLPVDQKPVGSACTSGYECEGGLCFPNPDKAASFCRENCKVSRQNCPAGFTCVSYTGIDFGGCLPTELTVQHEIGQSCESHTQCKSGVCVEGACRVPCTVGGDECAWNEACKWGASKFGCVPTGQEKQPDGGSCGSNWQCLSSVCWQSICRTACIPGNTACPQGTTCQDTGGGATGCLPEGQPQGKADGQACANGAECQSGQCVGQPGAGASYCRTLCVAGGTCPAGTTCTFYTDPTNGVCMPLGHPVGDYCADDSDCTTGMCHTAAQGALQCVQSCRSSDPRCPEGQECVQDQAYGPLCLPREDPQRLPTGSACQADGQCISNLCLDGACRDGCNVFDSACGEGMGCKALSDGNAGGCVPTQGLAAGSACDADSQCAGQFCASAGAAKVCVELCDRTAPLCSGGQACQPIGGYDVLGVCWGKPAGGDDVTGGGDEVIGGGGGGDSGFICALGSFRAPASSLPLWVLLGLAALVWIKLRAAG